MPLIHGGSPRKAALPLVKRLENDPNVTLEGYSMHIGRASPDPAFFRKWATMLGAAIVSLQRATGFEPRRINIRGRVPAPTRC